MYGWWENWASSFVTPALILIAYLRVFSTWRTLSCNKEAGCAKNRRLQRASGFDMYVSGVEFCIDEHNGLLFFQGSRRISTNMFSLSGYKSVGSHHDLDKQRWLLPCCRGLLGRLRVMMLVLEETVLHQLAGRRKKYAWCTFSALGYLWLHRALRETRLHRCMSSPVLVGLTCS